MRTRFSVKTSMAVSLLCLLACLAGHAKAELISYWPLDEGTGTVVADVIGGHDGEITGCTWLIPGKEGNAALEGTGGDRVDCGNGPTPTTDDLTISWWMIDNHSSYGRVMYKSLANGRLGYSILVRPPAEDSPLRFRIGSEGEYGGWGAECRLPSGAYNDGEWVHITCTYDSETDTATIYVNGALIENGAYNPKVGAAAHCDGVNNPDVPLYIRGGSETFTGVMDEVAIWDTALTAEEVMDVYQYGANPFDPEPSPGDGDAVVPENPLTLSWLNLPPFDPNGSVYVDVWFGTDPCTPGPGTWEKVVDNGEDVTSADVDASVETKYYWQVDTDIGNPSDANDVEGKLWSFTTVADPPPTVVINTPAQMTWSGEPVTLSATVDDSGPLPLTTFIEWSADPADGVVIADVYTDTPTVTITKDTDDPSIVTMTISVSDATNPIPVTASVEIDVYDDACAMARLGEGKDNPNDLNTDCDIDEVDLAIQVATWLNVGGPDGPVASLDQSTPAIVPNGDFETIVYPGTDIPATIEDGMYFNICTQTMRGGALAIYPYPDIYPPSPDIELPGWICAEGSNPNADIMQGGGWGGPDGSGDMALLCFASWGGPTYIESADPLSVPALNPGQLYELSCDIYTNGGPVVLELLADGVVIAPDAASSPALIAAEWVEFTRTYSSIPAGDVKIVVGTRDDAGTGWTGNRVSIDNVEINLVADPNTPPDENLPSVDAGLNMLTWSGEPVTLDPNVTNNDTQVPQRELSYLWTVDTSDGVVLDPAGDPGDPNTSTDPAPTVTITKPGGYSTRVKVRLDVTLAGVGVVSDTMTIDVYDNPCQVATASGTAFEYDPGDRNTDCTTNLVDFVPVAAAWLDAYMSAGPMDRPEE